MDYSGTVKKLREALLLSQSEFAELMGVSFATINRWENGHHQPAYKYKRKNKELCEKHGITME